MKQIRLLILVLVGFLLANHCYAYDFKVDGIRYNIIDADAKEVEVTNELDSDNEWVGYDGDIVVPQTVVYQGVTYKVVAVGTSAFAEEEQDWNFPVWSSLNSVTVSEGVRTIGHGAFHDCVVLKKVSLPSTITSIGESAFYECRSLRSLDIPNGVTTLGKNSFEHCKSMISIVIPKSMKTINCQFPNWGTLSVVVSKIEDPFDISNNTFSNLSPDAVLCVPLGTKNAYLKYSNWVSKFKEIVEGRQDYTFEINTIGNGIVNYSGVSFREEDHVFTTIEGTSATLEIIPDKAFRLKKMEVNSNDVTSFVTDNKYTINNIGSNISVYVEFESVASPIINFVDPVVKQVCVDNWDTNGDGELSEAEAGAVNNIGTAFRKTSIESFPEFRYFTGLYSIESEAFEKCSKLKTIILPNNIKSIGHQAFKESAINNLLIPEGVETIVYEAFEACQGLVSVSLPNSITYIGVNAFYENTSLAYVKSEIKTPFEMNWAVFVNLPDNAELHVPYGTKNLYETTSGWNVFGKIIEADPLPFNLDIISVGNGNVNYNGINIRNQSRCFILNEGTSATITFTPDNGYRIKSVKVNSTDVTSSISNNQYTISNITVNTALEVEFEAIPPITYTLSIKATGSGSASYNSTIIRGNTISFTVNDGTSATITFTPDNGYRIANLYVNNINVTSGISNNKYTISNISKNTTVEVTFEAIPVTTYSLSIKSTGGGSVSYNGTTIRSKTSSFIVNEGSSVSITLTPDNGYRIKSVKENDTNVTLYVSNGTYNINSVTRNTTVEVEFEVIPPTTYTLSIKSTGNGSVSYDGNTIRSKTSTFTVNEGASATISFTPDTGYRVKSVKVNSADVTSSVSNNQYIINNITTNTTLEIEFETIPITTYTLTVKATGSGYASCNGNSIRGETSTFTMEEGTSATITFIPDNGNRIKSAKVNNTDVISSIIDNTYTIRSISSDTFVEVEFEAIPPTTYSLIISATGNGNVTYNNTTLKNQTQTFTVTEGSYATITISPEDGYRIKSVVQDGSDVTASVDNNQYTTKMITSNTTLEVTFEAIPIPIYTLSVTASGNGMVNCMNTIVKNKTEAFSIEEGTTVIVTFSPDNGYQVASVKVNNSDVTAEVSNNSYSINMMKDNTTLEVAFEAMPTTVTADGVNYIITSQTEQTVSVSSGNYGQMLTVPATVTGHGKTWTVTGIEANALSGNMQLAAIIWNPEVAFTATVNNPNLLLYVKAERYAPSAIQNVVVNGIANSIVLAEAQSGNDFYCPQMFTARRISYTHIYKMTTGIGESQGWETIALPFDVQIITHEMKGEIVPFTIWTSDSTKKPFWLYQLTGSGFMEADAIKAYTPYIISMPNNSQYSSEWLLNGNVTFSATNVTISPTDNMQTTTYSSRTFVPNYAVRGADEGLFALNAVNEFVANNSGMTDGSKFVLNMRQVHPFEAYMTSSSNARTYFDIFDDLPTDIREKFIVHSLQFLTGDRVFDLQGRRVEYPSKKGVYIVNGKKMIIK